MSRLIDKIEQKVRTLDGSTTVWILTNIMMRERSCDATKLMTTLQLEYCTFSQNCSEEILDSIKGCRNLQHLHLAHDDRFRYSNDIVKGQGL
jgi:hypothetical protein